MDYLQPYPYLRKCTEKTLVQPVRPGLVACCPTMGLIAVVTQDEQLQIYRLDGGQRAFGLKRKSPRSSIDAICWKYNGQYIAVAWDDGNVDIVSSDTGKVVRRGLQERSSTQEGHTGSDGSSRVSCIGWGLNFIDPAPVKARVAPQSGGSTSQRPSLIPATTDDWDQSRDDVTLDDFLDRLPDLRALNVEPALPDQLALLDVGSLMPKLSVLQNPPASSQKIVGDVAPDLFTSQASIDAIFHSTHQANPNAVDVLLLGRQNKSIQVMIYDTLEIGAVTMPAGWGASNCKALLCISHPYTCVYFFLMELSGQAASKSRLALIPLNLRFVHSAGTYLPLIASRTTQLQNLLRYIHQTVKAIISHWHHAQELPSKFMRNINETLSERSEANLMENLYHLAVTGNCPPTIKDWLVDELTETGHKRWDATVAQAYAKIVELAHENLLPAMDRACVVLSTLRGLAKYHDGSSLFNVQPEAFTRILTTLRCLRLLVQNVLIYAAQERREFAEFSRWLRHEIDVQATDPSSSSAEELAERDAGVDYSQLLSYIQIGMVDSRLKPFLVASGLLSGEVKSKLPSLPSFEEIAKAAEMHREKQAPPTPKPTPASESTSSATLAAAEALSISSLCGTLMSQCHDLFAKITSWQVSSSAIECAIVLEEERATSMYDMRVVYEESNHDELVVFVVIIPAYSKGEIRLHKVVHCGHSDRSSGVQKIRSSIAKFFQNGSIKDVKFADDHSLLILQELDGNAVLLKIPLDCFFPTSPASAGEVDASSMALPKGKASNISKRANVLLNRPEDLRNHVIHVFSEPLLFKPSSMQISSRKGRKWVVVLSEAGSSYQILSLETPPERDVDMDAPELDDELEE